MTGFSDKAFVQRWHRMSLLEQLGNVGSEVDRVIAWRQHGNEQFATNALYRVLELMDLTIADPRWLGRLKELTRAREIMCDLFVGDNVYNTPPEYLSKYFYQFALAARRNNGR